MKERFTTTAAAPITLWTWSKIVRRLANAAELPQFSTHTLRHLCLTDLARASGVTADDRIEVQPWMEKEGRFSFVTSDPRAVDLACFRKLAKAQSAK